MPFLIPYTVRGTDASEENGVIRHSCKFSIISRITPLVLVRYESVSFFMSRSFRTVSDTTQIE
jgi:hypothetical protein